MSERRCFSPSEWIIETSEYDSGYKDVEDRSVIVTWSGEVFCPLFNEMKYVRDGYIFHVSEMGLPSFRKVILDREYWENDGPVLDVNCVPESWREAMFEALANYGMREGIFRVFDFDRGPISDHQKRREEYRRTGKW